MLFGDHPQDRLQINWHHSFPMLLQDASYMDMDKHICAYMVEKMLHLGGTYVWASLTDSVW